MSSPARLLALRLHGFKSFAERTLVEFGGGISAVVGPNGSGKSNLADALRWALGEQGRALRSRKSEDVIFAGSDKRAAVGMADVTIVLDNADGLLPVDYSVLELGRRLYRSGENDYLLNKQRVRLRDLVDLLDAAHLADNAFLFIGQGMVDQALALRPEERRPLFEDVAGVRRHERRRRRAEEQLTESEANLARVQDILAELRPQARRLAAQAEQQASRLTAGDDLADALILAAHARWHEAAGRAAEGAARRSGAAREADAEMTALRTAEDAAGTLAAELAERAEAERGRREAHDSTRAALTGLQVRSARLGGEVEAIARDRARLADERGAAESDLELQRRLLARPFTARDVSLDAAVADADRALAELAALRAERQAKGEEAAALRRAAAAREAEAETARRRLADAERRAEAERAASEAGTSNQARLESAVMAARDRVEGAVAAEGEATVAREAARIAADQAEASRQAAAERAASLGALLAAQRGRLDGLETALAEEASRGIARVARRHGGRRVDEELVVDPPFRAAVEAALDEATRAYLVPKASVADLATERGMLVVAGESSKGFGLSPAEARFVEAAGEVGATRLPDAIRRDPVGAATRLARRVVVVPDLAAALSIQPALPAGWTAVVRDGSAVVGEHAVRLGGGDGTFERQATAERLRADVARLTTESEAATAATTTATSEAAAARQRLDEARAAESRAAAERRSAEEAERAASRSLEAAVRETGWQGAQADRMSAELRRLRDEVAALGATAGQAPTATTPDEDSVGVPAAAIASWEARIVDLRAARDRVGASQAAQDATRRESEAVRARAEAAAAIDADRIDRSDREAAALSDREASLVAEREGTAAELAVAEQKERDAASALAEVRSADAAARDRLAAAERAALAARDRVRAAEERLRAAERHDLEARLGRDSLREQLLVELAGLGELGVRRLQAEATPGAGDRAAEPPADLAESPEDADAPDAGDAPSDDEGAALEIALAAVADRWASDAPPGDAPSPGRLAALRRRYHELGAASPFAVDEYAEVKARLETLDAQEADLRQAIAKTRELIAELNRMIADQFATTFRALEAAFDARFRHLFGGGYAHLVMTDPDDLSSTGIEIVARPPGKKQQALAMLSGGERALTAVALLFAMLEVRPVPFCVLDEVDAALDEANVGRFTAALRELAAATQFIVITHNRGTIEAADALYGVTVGDDSVSRVISLRLDEAQAIAEAHTNGSLAGVS